MSLAGLTINDADLAAFSARVLNVAGLTGVTEGQVASVARGGPFDGVFELTSTATRAARTVRLVLLVEATTPTQLAERVQAVEQWCHGRAATRHLVRFALDAMPGRTLAARLVSATVTNDDPKLDALAAEVELTFTCADPAWRATTPTVVSLSAGQVAVPLGSARSAPRIRWTGPCSEAWAEYRDADGLLVGRIAFADSVIATGEYLEWDAATGVAVRVAAGVPTRADHERTGGGVFLLDPGHESIALPVAGVPSAPVPGTMTAGEAGVGGAVSVTYTPGWTA